MKRPLVKDATLRMKDVAVGDVVSRTPGEREGWFQVAEITRMFNGKIQVADKDADLAVSGHDFDLIGVQVITELNLPPEPILDPGGDDTAESGATEESTEAKAETPPEPPAPETPAEPKAETPAAPPPPPLSLAPPSALFAAQGATS